jgi:hypothetical protein
MWDNLEKYCRAGQATDDNMAHALCVLDTWGYKHTLGICKAYRCCSTTVVARSRLDVTLYIHCLYFIRYFNCLSQRLFFYHGGTTLVGQGLVIVEDSWSHSDTPQSIGLIWTSDQPNTETSTWQHTTHDRHPFPRRDWNPQSQQASGRRPTP